MRSGLESIALIRSMSHSQRRDLYAAKSIQTACMCLGLRSFTSTTLEASMSQLVVFASWVDQLSEHIPCTSHIHFSINISQGSSITSSMFIFKSPGSKPLTKSFSSSEDTKKYILLIPTTFSTRRHFQLIYALNKTSLSQLSCQHFRCCTSQFVLTKHSQFLIILSLG